MSSTVSSSQPPRSFGGHPLHTDGDILAVGFASDGSLWSVEEPGVLRCWNVHARRQIDWASLDELATVWAFDADSSLLAAGSDELGIWQVENGEQLLGWPLPSWCTAIAFQPSGNLIATGHDDGSVHLWDRTTGQGQKVLTAHDRPISALAFSADGTQLASAGEDKLIHIWKDGRRVGTLEGHTDRIPAIAWAPDGQRLYSAGWDTTARVWDVVTQEPIILLNSHSGQVFTLALSPDGKLLACADSKSAIHLWDTEKFRTLAVIREQVGEVRTIAFRSDGQTLAWGGVDRVVHLWEPGRGAEPDSAVDPLRSRTCVAVSPDGGRLVSLGAGTELRVWDVASGQPAVDLEGTPTLRAFAASSDGRSIVASRVEADSPDPRSTLAVWAADTGKLKTFLPGQMAPLTALAVSPDSSQLASGGYQNADVWLWNLTTGEPALILPNAANGASVECLAYHPIGRYLAVGGIDWMAASGNDGWTCVWDLAEPKARYTFPGGTTAVAFQPASGSKMGLLAVASLTQSIRLFDLEDGELVLDLQGHMEAVTCLAFSPVPREGGNGRLLASGSDDRTVRLWDVTTGEQVASLELDTQVKALCFAPDGQALFTGNGNTSCYRLSLEQIFAGSL